jgi:hypothetical protein
MALHRISPVSIIEAHTICFGDAPFVVGPLGIKYRTNKDQSNLVKRHVPGRT